MGFAKEFSENMQLVEIIAKVDLEEFESKNFNNGNPQERKTDVDGNRISAEEVGVLRKSAKNVIASAQKIEGLTKAVSQTRNAAQKELNDKTFNAFNKSAKDFKRAPTHTESLVNAYQEVVNIISARLPVLQMFAGKTVAEMFKSQKASNFDWAKSAFGARDRTGVQENLQQALDNFEFQLFMKFMREPNMYFELAREPQKYFKELKEGDPLKDAINSLGGIIMTAFKDIQTEQDKSKYKLPSRMEKMLLDMSDKMGFKDTLERIKKNMTASESLVVANPNAEMPNPDARTKPPKQ